MEILQLVNSLIALPAVVYIISVEKRLSTLNTKMDIMLQVREQERKV